jgi:hypothetical protein
MNNEPSTGVPEAMANMYEQQPPHRVVYADGEKLPNQVLINGPDALAAMQKHIIEYLKDLPEDVKVTHIVYEVDSRHVTNNYRMVYTRNGVSRFALLSLEVISS